MGCNSSKDLGTVEEPKEMTPEQVAQKEKAEYDAARKVAAKEQKEYEAANKVANKEEAEHEQALANLNKEQEEAEAARIAALEAAGNLDELVEAAKKARAEVESANAVTRAYKQKRADDLDKAVVEARKKKEEADAIAEKELLEAEEAARIEEKERLEAEEARALAEKERLEAEEAARVAAKEKAEADEAAIRLEESKRQKEIEDDAKAAKAAALQKQRDEAPIYHKGALMKKGDDMLGGWKTRFFIAKNAPGNFDVDYFESEGGKAKGSIECNGFRVSAFSSDDVASHGPHGFKLEPIKAGRTWWLKADSADAQKEWIHVFARACDKAGVSGSQVTLEKK